MKQIWDFFCKLPRESGPFFSIFSLLYFYIPRDIYKIHTLGLWNGRRGNDTPNKYLNITVLKSKMRFNYHKSCD